jgi:beta-galactosidase
MNKLCLFKVILFSLLPLVWRGTSLGATEPLRPSLNLNREWRFELGDHPGAEAVGYDDSNWGAVGLPHSFSMPYFLGPRFYTGYGWYRKNLTIPVSLAGKRLSLEFDGVFQVAEVFVNGRKAGMHRGGYNGFSIDITAVAKAGDNLLAVRVNNRWDARLAPRAGEHVFSGGIYREVRLVATSPLHVEWYGTWVTTPEVSRESSLVNVKTELVNASAQPKTATLRNQVLDPEGKIVTEVVSTQEIPAGQTVTVEQVTPKIASPRLWHPDTPVLYTLRTLVSDHADLVDTYDTPFGFRWFKWTADQGFFLNGEHFYLMGANVHQDHAGWGDAVTQAGARRDVQMVKDAGFNFIRGSHYPHAPAFSRACDELGIVFWSENAFWGMGGGGKGAEGSWNASAYPINDDDEPAFEASVKQSLAEMIRIHRNHPSIVVWSMCNEAYFSAKEVMPKMRDFLRRLVAYTHELDPTRPAAIGGSQRGDVDKLGDIAGYNGDGARLFINPGIPSLVSEYGSTMEDRPGTYLPGWGDLQKGQANTAPYFWRFPWRSGEAIWCAFDHGSIASVKFGSMGLVDYFRLPKRQWYWYRNEYRHIAPPNWPKEGVPARLGLSADQLTIRGTDATDDVHLIVTVLDSAGVALSNNVPVTLRIESGPGEFPTGRSITFEPKSDIVIRDGQAAIEFRSYDGGTSVIVASSPGLQEARLSIVTEGQPVYVPGKTPLTKDRPYVRFTANALATADLTGVNLAKDRPTRATTELPKQAARLANDENLTTFWASATDDLAPWWQVDLENVYEVTSTDLRFTEPGNHRYRIEVSIDGNAWTLIVDQSATTRSPQSRKDQVASPSAGRFLRITILSKPAGLSAQLSEVQVYGKRTN